MLERLIQSCLKRSSVFDDVLFTTYLPTPILSLETKLYNSVNLCFLPKYGLELRLTVLYNSIFHLCIHKFILQSFSLNDSLFFGDKIAESKKYFLETKFDMMYRV